MRTTKKGKTEIFPFSEMDSVFYEATCKGMALLLWLTLLSAFI